MILINNNRKILVYFPFGFKFRYDKLCSDFFFFVSFFFNSKNFVFFSKIGSIISFFQNNFFFISRFFLYKFKKKIGVLFYYFFGFVWRVYKAHGINMRLIKRYALKAIYLRVGFGHGFYWSGSLSFSFKIYRKRYFMIYGYDKRLFEVFSYHMRYLRTFFRYKLIGLKSKRDKFKIKVGKKKTF